MSISAMKQALRALEDYRKHTAGVMIPQTRCQGDEAINALRQAIEQAEKQEPVAWWDKDENRCDEAFRFQPTQNHTQPLYAAPVHASDMSQERVDETPKCKDDPRAPHGFDRNASHSADRYVCECEGWEPPKKEWVNLTDEEIKEIIGPWGETPIKGYTRKLFDQIEAKLKEKNT
jgi:hypothetical protein